MTGRKPKPMIIANPRSKGALRSVMRWGFFVSLALTITAGAIAIGTYIYFARDLPQLIPFEEHDFGGITTVYADDGQVIGELHESHKGMVPYEKIPRTLILAFLATEDVRFFSHEGIDTWGILRAAFQNLKAGHVVQGGSTITQQLAKTFYLSNEKTLTRKVREAIVARRMERIYTKEQILLLYLNKIYLGHGSYGVQAAARNYFRKNVWDLSLGEMAMLAGLPAAPSYYNPARNMDAALERRNVVLRRMLDRGYLNPAEGTLSESTDEIAQRRFEEAGQEQPHIHPLQDPFREKTPYFTKAALERLPKDWKNRELQIHTTANLRQSFLAQRALALGMHDLARQQGWPGPITHLDDPKEIGALLERTTRYFGGLPEPGSLAPAVITNVTKKGIDLQITPSVSANIDSKSLQWAGPYTIFPVNEHGNRNRGGSVSLTDRKGRMKGFQGVTKTFSPGDVVLVRLLGEERAPGQPLPRKNKNTTPRSHAVQMETLPQIEGAVVAFDLHTGASRALVGGYDYDHSELNHAKRQRPTGSTMKPIVYSKLYEKGMPPSERFSGAPFTTYCPEASDYSTPRHNDMTLWDALTYSKNNISLRALWHLRKAGEKSVAEYRNWGEKMGLRLHGHCSEVLGADHTLWDMLGAYGRFAKKGQALSQHLIRKVVADDGEILVFQPSLADPANNTRDLLGAFYDTEDLPPSTIPPEVAYVTARNLVEVNRRGTGRRAGKRLGKRFETAGKTGTLPYDVWFLGWSPRYLTGVWIGASDNRRVLGARVKQSVHNRITGASTALPVWIEWMSKGHETTPGGKIGGSTPNRIAEASICPEDGKIALSGGMSIPHLKGTEPTDVSTNCSTAAPDSSEEEF